MMVSRMVSVVALAAALGPVASAQQCAGGGRVEGTVLDPNGNAIAGAAVRAADGTSATADASGRFVLPCAQPGTLTVDAEGFAPGTAAVRVAGGVAHLTIRLTVARVETDVQVGDSDSNDKLDAATNAGASALDAKQVAQLADDPDDFQRQLQVLASSSGGIPGNAKITVDGFQNASALPPKSSIAAIRVNPDMFSAEYEDPPYEGGRIEIITKPGADTYHGAVFFIDSDGSFNATDPFSVTATPAGKRRYGFELSGPLQKKKSDLSLALEKRDIDEFNVVNAVTLDGPLHQTVAAPQRLWIASARADFQVSAKDIATLSFSANTNNLGNQGIGGLTLPEAGYDSLKSEYDLRLTNTQTLSPNLLHETHIGFTWKRTAQTPLSTAPNLQVAGYFQGGGATEQNLNDRERNLEIDDDVLLTRGKQSWKIGAQSLGIFVHDYDPDTFNGAFVFGGGSAPALDGTGGTANIDGLEQYRRAQLGLPGGVPTTYQLTSGTPLVPFTQWRLALYVQDTIKLAPRLDLSAGMRYSFQTSPETFANFGPRLGLSWAPDKKSAWVFHLRAGLFNYPIDQSLTVEAYRLNGTRQSEALVYQPSFAAPLTPVPGSLAVSTVRAYPRSFEQVPVFQTQSGIEHDFPHHWHALANLFYAASWGDTRTRNINAPLVGASLGAAPDPIAALLAPRPGAPNRNILQYQNSGHLNGTVTFLGLDQHSYKRFGFFAGYLHFDFTGNTGRGAVEPQSSYSDAGERARPDWARNHQVFVFGNVNLPWKLALSPQFDAHTGNPYDVTTGTDANGDGDFNDRPSYAPAGATGSGVYATRFGLLTTNAVNGDVGRNRGTMPTVVHLDLNLSRAWKLGGGKESSRTLTLNARTANLLNHTNVTAVGSIVSSPTFTQSLAAEAARRLELGARFAF